MTSRSPSPSHLASSLKDDFRQPSFHTHPHHPLIPKEQDLFVSKKERMNMIPSPAQAMTILRALNATDLKNYPLELLEILLPLLQELLHGKIELYTSIPHHTFIALNNIVHHLLGKTSSHSNNSPYTLTSHHEKDYETLNLNASHVMMVIRAINAIPSSQLDKNAQKRMKYVKEHLIALSFGNPKPLISLFNSQDKHDKTCAKIITNALSRAYDEAQFPPEKK